MIQSFKVMICIIQEFANEFAKLLKLISKQNIADLTYEVIAEAKNLAVKFSFLTHFFMDKQFLLLGLSRLEFFCYKGKYLLKLIIDLLMSYEFEKNIIKRADKHIKWWDLKFMNGMFKK